MLRPGRWCRTSPGTLQAIRTEDDAEWALGLEEAPPRQVRLMADGTYNDRSASARPLRRAGATGRRVAEERRIKLKQQRAAPAGPPVLEAQVRGRLPLFTVPRVLTDATSARSSAGRSSGGRKPGR
ncbi:hypothetical protein [Streptomyces sp. NPDC088246]|uniref:hypothetical protein n=1 Tax=Streptomyces sp. NPDC088246 TaxID=3365842 RepID=UPI0037FEF90E